VAQSPKPPQQAILAVHQQWLEHELAGNRSGVLALCVDDVVWLPPNEPALRGKTAVAAWLTALPKTRLQRIEITNLQIECAGGLACKLADFATWLDPAEPVSDQPLIGTHLWVLREVAPGRWRVAVVAWSMAEPGLREPEK
jgi:ketosteroid isomerase-like protein